MMVPGSEILAAVTLIISTKLLNDLSTYEPSYVDSSIYHYKDDNNPNSVPRAVNFNPLFKSSILFPKCCPPGFIYDIPNKICKDSPDTSSIYDDMNVAVNLIKSGLSECQVVVDRFVKKKNFTQADSKRMAVSIKVEKKSYPPGKYCIDKTTQKDVYVLRMCADRQYCLGTAQPKHLCINKCCWDGYSYEGKWCKFTSNKGLADDKFSKYYESEDDYEILYGVTNCPKQQLRKVDSFNFYINTNGSLVNIDTTKIYNLGDYCLESAFFTDSAQDSEDIIILCDKEKGVSIRSAIILVLVIIIFAGFVTAFLKSFLIYELKGLTVILIACYTFVEAIFWIMIAMEMLPAKFGDFCYVFGYCHVLMSIARLSWLNVLQYRVWRTMGMWSACTFKTITEDICLKLICYSLYAMTIPAVVMVVFILGHSRVYPLSIFVPQINLFACVVELNNYGALHVLIPVIVLITINLILFGKILCCCPPDNKGDIYLISYQDDHQNQDTYTVNNKKAQVIMKLALVNVLTYIYYMCAFSKLFVGEVTLENVGDKLPPSYL